MAHDISIPENITPKEEKFCKSYVQHYDSVRAAKAAQYGNNGGDKARALLKRKEIIKYIETLQNERIKSLNLTDHYVLDKLK